MTREAARKSPHFMWWSLPSNRGSMAGHDHPWKEEATAFGQKHHSSVTRGMAVIWGGACGHTAGTTDVRTRARTSRHGLNCGNNAQLHASRNTQMMASGSCAVPLSSVTRGLIRPRHSLQKMHFLIGPSFLVL